jgi:uncharacterized membrane protein
MSASSTVSITPSERSTGPNIYRGLAALLALICIAVVIGVVDLLLQGQVPSLSAAISAWSWVFNVVLILLVIVIVVWIVRLVYMGVGVEPHAGLHERRLRRREYSGRVSDRDPAIEIARERFARGEITQEQYEQTLRNLGRVPEPLH